MSIQWWHHGIACNLWFCPGDFMCCFSSEVHGHQPCIFSWILGSRKGHGPWMYNILFNVYRCFFPGGAKLLFSKLWRYDTMSMTVNVLHRHRVSPNWAGKFTYTNKAKSVLTENFVYLVYLYKWIHIYSHVVWVWNRYFYINRCFKNNSQELSESTYFHRPQDFRNILEVDEILCNAAISACAQGNNWQWLWMDRLKWHFTENTCSQIDCSNDTLLGENGRIRANKLLRDLWNSIIPTSVFAVFYLLLWSVPSLWLGRDCSPFQ